MSLLIMEISNIFKVDNKWNDQIEYTLLKKFKGTWSAPSLVCGHSQVQLLEDMHNCTSLKSVMLKNNWLYLQWVWHNPGTSLSDNVQ